jgi:hypothetical protein
MRNRNEQNQVNYVMDAMEVLCSAEADVFAKTLDALGWMIVPKPPFEGDRWRLNEQSADCPSWADSAAPRPRGDPSPTDPEERIKWVAAALEYTRNLYHRGPDGRWCARTRGSRGIEPET